MAKFVVSKPIDVPIRTIGKARFIDKNELKKLKNNHPTLKEIGCYVFSIGTRPWYVGKTTNRKKGISGRVFDNDKILGCLSQEINKKQGVLRIWTITQDGGTRPPVNMIDEIETTLIQLALRRNSDLLNKQKTKGKNWTIKGVTADRGRGRPPRDAEPFRKVIGLGN